MGNRVRLHFGLEKMGQKLRSPHTENMGDLLQVLILCSMLWNVQYENVVWCVARNSEGGREGSVLCASRGACKCSCFRWEPSEILD